MKNRRTQVQQLVNEPTQTLKEIDQEIARLKERAASIVATEKAGVIERIKEAVSYYGITPSELGFGGTAKLATTAKAEKPTKRKAQPRTITDSAEVTRAKLLRKPLVRAGVIKYKDDAGNSWSGFGPKPRWLTAALAAGKTPEDLKA